jgi:P27 family predicted phage terminase small subunit
VFVRIVSTPRHRRSEHDGELPDELSDDAKQAWFATVPELRKHGLPGTIEQEALVCYCEAVVTHREAVREVRAKGISVLGARGGLVRNPACTVEGDMARVIRSFAAEFGLTPAARGHVKSTRGLETDDADDFFPKG